MTPAQRWMGRVARVGCIVCILLGHGPTPAQVHHLREGRIARNDFLTIPLCDLHHAAEHPGVPSVHKRKAELMLQLGLQSEFELLARVLEIIEKERGR
jgi:hypothetical protein